MATASKIIDMKREPARRRHDDVQVLYLRDAARSAGEAFAFEEEVAHATPRSFAAVVWICTTLVAAIGLAAVYY